MVALRGPLAALVAAGAAPALASCGGPAVPVGSPGSHISAIPATELPAQLGGLDVAAEKPPAELAKTTGTYAQALGFYSLRQHNLVEATLEVVRLGHSADWRSASFRQSLVNQISGSIPTPITLSGRTVYESSATGGGLTVWFDGADLFILTVRTSYNTPRGLIEDAVGVHLS